MSSSINPIVFALRHPIAVIASVAALALGSALAFDRMAIDIFPTLDLPVIYVAQPYNGMSAAQMESQLVSTMENHSLYIGGIRHVESKNIQNITLLKLYFNPGTDMAQAMAETNGYLTRARFYQPTGTAPPFIARFDTGSVPVGYLVLEDDTGKRSAAQLQDLALQRIRPLFGSLPGVSSPPPMGGNLRSIVLYVDPDKQRSNRATADEIIAALANGNAVSPSGNVRIGDQMQLAPTNGMVLDPQDLAKIPLRPGSDVYLGDLGPFVDSADTPSGFAVVNGKRTVYLMVTKRAEASTLAVVKEVRKNLPMMQESLPEDVHLRFEFDQSPYVREAMLGVAFEGILGAVLTGLMVLLFLRDWRSVIVVVLNIPLALMGATLALWITGQTINIMTLGGLALAVGILVDEATVEVENIHTQMALTDSLAVAVRRGNSETAVPRLLAMLCILAVFTPMFFMEGAAKNMFKPMALAVGFAMITSYILSSTFVPVVSIWLLKGHSTPVHTARGFVLRDRLMGIYERGLAWIVRKRGVLAVGYLAACAAVVGLVAPELGTEIFPQVDTGQFQLRVRAPTGTRIEWTDDLAKETTRLVAEAAGPGNVQATVGYVGMTPTNYSNQVIYLWTAGPEEAILRVALKPGSVRVDDLKHRLREELPGKLKNWLAVKLRATGLPEDDIRQRTSGLRLSFEPADVVNEVMSFGSPTPVEVVVHGPNITANLAFSEKLRQEMAKIKSLRDLQFAQAQDYPTVDVQFDREKLGMSGATVKDATSALLTATSSSRLVAPNFWADPTNGIGYQVQVQIPIGRMDTTDAVAMVPVKLKPDGGQILLRDVADVREGKTPSQIDRQNMRRMVSLIANIEDSDLGNVSSEIEQAVARAGPPPRGSRVEIRGQIKPMKEMFKGLRSGLLLAVAAIAILLTAYFQSIRLALVAVAAVPAVLSGVILMLIVTGTTLNIQSFMGAIMAVGVAVANAILLVTFAERARREGAYAGGSPMPAPAAAMEAAKRRMRPILMTSCAMLAGMVPMALAVGDGGEQTSPLGRAVIGGLVASTFATLFILPAFFTLLQYKNSTESVSLDPADPNSPHYRADAAAAL